MKVGPKWENGEEKIVMFHRVRTDRKIWCTYCNQYPDVAYGTTCKEIETGFHFWVQVPKRERLNNV